MSLFSPMGWNVPSKGVCCNIYTHSNSGATFSTCLTWIRNFWWTSRRYFSIRASFNLQWKHSSPFGMGRMEILLTKKEKLTSEQDTDGSCSILSLYCFNRGILDCENTTNRKKREAFGPATSAFYLSTFAYCPYINAWRSEWTSSQFVHDESTN